MYVYTCIVLGLHGCALFYQSEFLVNAPNTILEFFMKTSPRSYLAYLCIAVMVCGCGATDLLGDKETSYPKRKEQIRNESRGKLTGEGGLLLGGGSGSSHDEGNNPLGVNSFLWRATLDTLAFMPLVSADPFGGVVITDWYEDPKAQGERFKVNALILDRSLRADGVKISLFKQQLDAGGVWRDSAIEESRARELEDTILTRARQLRVKTIQ